MSHQMTVILTDKEYQRLTTEATKNGKKPEMLFHEMIQRLPPSPEEKHAMTGRELAEKLYQEGKLLTLANPSALTADEQAERERLARLFAADKLASDIIIEDRGRY
jgi:hypothetical protein